MLLMFGYTRFIWEFFSAADRVLFNITELGIWALATGIIGTGWLIVLLIIKHKRKEQEVQTA